MSLINTERLEIVCPNYILHVDKEKNNIDIVSWCFAGFARLWGYPVGILGNNGVLFSESALKVGQIRPQF